MKLAWFQSLDQAGGGSRASLRGTMMALHKARPEWKMALVTQNAGPLSRSALECGVTHLQSEFPRFRKAWEKPAFWWECRKLAKALLDFAPDAVLSNEWVTAPHALSVGRKLGIPAMSYVRDFAAMQRGRKYQLHRMDRLLCVCESMRQALIGVGYDPEKVLTVYNPVLRPPVHEPDPVLREQILGHAGVDRWLLYLGRISPRKTQIAAVEMLRRLREITDQRWGLLLAGDADDAYAAEVRHAAAAAGLNDAVLELGMIAEPGWLFDLADASVLTSKSEGLARVLIESFLCGKPGFSFPLDGLEDIYGEALPFFVPERAQPGDLAAKIAGADRNLSQCQQHTEHLRIMLEQRHSLESHVSSFEAAVGGQ